MRIHGNHARDVLARIRREQIAAGRTPCAERTRCVGRPAGLRCTGWADDCPCNCEPCRTAKAGQ